MLPKSIQVQAPTPTCQRRHRILVALLGLMLFGSALALGQEPRVDMTLEPDGKVGTEEILRLTVTLESPQGKVGLPGFELENLQAVSGPSQSTSVQIVNGVSSQSVSFTWMVQPQRLGPARIFSGAVRVGDRTVELPEKRLEVIENPPQRSRLRRQRDPFASDPWRSRDPFESLFNNRRRRERRPPVPTRAPEIFLEAEVSPRRPYVGQQVLYTLYLYTDVTVRSVTPTELPEFQGFWAQVIPQPNDPEPEWVVRDNREVGRVVLLQRALFPRRAGELRIEPVKAAITALVRDTGPMASFFPQLQEIQRSARPTTIRVRELPEPKPANFQGAVGNLRLSATLEPADLEMGDAATLTLELEGEGHLQGLPAPVLPEIPEVQVFPPQQQAESSLRGTRVRGRRQWSYVLVPQRPGVHELPAIDIAYFDPKRSEYRSATAEGDFVLEVRGTTRSVRSGGIDVELHGIRTANLPHFEAADEGIGLGWHALFWAPWALVLLAFFVRRRQAPDSADLRAGRGASGRRAARRHLLAQLESALAEERPRQAATQVEEAWRGYLAERWDVQPGTASTRWSQLLEEKGVARQTADELVQLADDLHYLRYAPKLSSTDDLRRELVERSRRLVRSL